MSKLRHALTVLIHRPEITKIENSSIRILNLACGRSDETGVLLEVLAGSSEAPELIGLDIRNKEIEEATMRWKFLAGRNVSFLVEDATRMQRVQALNTGFDYVFMRHQNFWNGGLVWYKIFDGALHRLKPHGLLIITSYFDREHLQAMEALQALGAKLLLTWKNPYSRMIDPSCQKSVDRHIAIFSQG